MKEIIYFFDELKKRIQNQVYSYNNESFETEPLFDNKEIELYAADTEALLIQLPKENQKQFSKIIARAIIIQFDTLKYLHEEVKIYLAKEHGYWYILTLIEIFRCCDIELIESIIPLLDNDSFFKFEEMAESKAKRINETQTLTTDHISVFRQVLTVETILEELGINRGNTDRTAITAFIQFLTGRELGKTPGTTNIYKNVYKPTPDTRRGIDMYNKDCDFVSQKLDELGLSALATKVKNGKEKQI